MKSKFTTAPGYEARTCKRPKQGEVVATHLGACPIVKVHGNGLRLDVRSPVHGVETVERAPHAHWTVRVVTT